ncbi:MAG: precorrin-2 C(20)-methyltransferase [Deltaproteobacteria bacterium]|nr:precorrin-2 C(20)-methyltransferase [Deltaproteobacteria bacterium]MCL5880376.1 precorrin-2 C(20)-methyltransferase [Deltaproteobacteria bacterium]MDA8303802.1 precorrin-2 C(20)-methyltransferase [Deltaproteobacteria bacterium]
MVGVGPGDPELITLKAVKVLKSSDFIFYPEVTFGKNKIAYNIVKSAIELFGGRDIAGERMIPLEIEMKLSKGRNDELYKENALKIIGKLREGACSYITIGDPMFYSTYWGLYNAIKNEAVKNNEELKINITPGISSFNYSFNLIGEPYIIKNSSVFITVPIKKDLKEIEGEINFMAKKSAKPQVIVFMKTGAYLKNIMEIFKNSYINNFKEGKLKLYLIERSRLLDGFCDDDLNLKTKINSGGLEVEFDYFSILIGVFL